MAFSKAQRLRAIKSRRRLNALRSEIALRESLQIKDFLPKNIEATLKKYRLVLNGKYAALLPKQPKPNFIDSDHIKRLITASGAKVTVRGSTRKPHGPDYAALAELIVAVVEALK